MKKSKKPKKRSKKPAKAKKKKGLRGELQRLWRTGRYWEWLEALESWEGEEPDRGLWLEAWRNIARRALRSPENLKDLWDRQQLFQSRPDFPDLEFLLLLRDFVENGELQEKISTIQGLSLPAAALQKQALLWKEEDLPEVEIQRALKTLAERPEKATRKTYNSLARVVEPYGPGPLTRALEELAHHIPEIRRLNRKTTVRMGASGLDSFFLDDLDQIIQDATRELAPALRRILLFPFAFQIARLFEWLAREGEFRAAAEAASLMPFLFSLAAGDRAKEIRERLLPFQPEVLSAADIAVIGKRLSGADLEEKLALLNQLRIGARKSLHEMEGGLDFFEDFGPEEPEAEELLHLFAALYRDVLEDLTTRQPDLSERERLELARVMDGILFRDLNLLAPDAGPEQIAEILELAGRAGCLGPRLAVLALITAGRVGAGRLARLAKACLQDRFKPGPEDMLAVLDRFPDLYFPYLSALKPLAGTVQNFEDLLPSISSKVIDYLEFSLLMNAAVDEDSGPFSFLFANSVNQSMRQLQILRRELKSFEDHPAFRLVGTYLRSFPDGRLTEEGCRSLAGAVYEEHGTLAPLIERLEYLSQGSASGGRTSLPSPFDPFADDVIEFQHLGLLQVIVEHPAAAEELSTETIELLVAGLTRKRQLSQLEQRLLLKLANLLAKKEDDGKAAALHRQLHDLLLGAHKRGPRRAGKRRK